MKTAKIKVSVIVPAYNTAEYLPRCLDSLVRQTLKEIEIIVVDNNSNDDGKTADVIKSYAERYPKLIVPLFCKKPGASAARNMGIRHAKGDFIGFADSDDYCKPSMYSKLLRSTGDGKTDMSFCGCSIKSLNSTYSKNLLPVKDRSIDNKRNFLIALFGPCTLIIKKQILMDNKLFFKEGIIYEDTALIPTLVIYVDSVGIVNETLYNYIERSGSVMNQLSYSSTLWDVFTAVQSLIDAFKKRKLFKIYYNEIEYIAINSVLLSAGNRFIKYPDHYKAAFRQIHNLMMREFHKWYKNKYFKNDPIKTKILCWLYFTNGYKILNLYLAQKKWIQTL